MREGSVLWKCVGIGHQATGAQKRLLSSLPDSIIGCISSSVSYVANRCTQRFFEIAFVASGCGDIHVAKSLSGTADAPN